MVSHKIDDFAIIDEEPIVVTGIGPWKRKVFLRQLYIHEYYKQFVPRFVIFMNMLQKLDKDISLPKGRTWTQKKKIEEVHQRLVRRAFSYRELRALFASLLRKAGLMKMSTQYFEHWVKPTQMVRMFLFVYKFNVDGVKKNIMEALREIAKVANLPSQTSIEQSAKGGLRDRLMPRFPKSMN